jgi:hypothetical protein
LASLGLRFYTVAALVGFGIVWASGIYLALIGFRGNPAECSSRCLVGVVPAGLGWLLVLLCGHRALIRFITENRGANMKRAESLEIGDGAVEKRMLEIVRAMLSKRRVAKRLRNVETLAWSDMQGWESPRFKWQGYRKPSMLVISAGLRERLEMQDWSTYLSWHYLERGWLKPRQTWYVAQPIIRALLPALPVVAVGLALSLSVGQYASQLFLSIFGPAVLMLAVYCLGPAFKELLLRIDTVAAESLGKGILLSLFTKIDGLQLRENENAKRRTGWIARLWPEPNITERINNLQS